MTTSVTWLGHGTFSIETSGKTVIIDPFFTDNPSASVSADDVSPDAIIVSHGHGDHIGDTIDIAKRTVRLQSGYLYHYAFAMLIGVAALVTWFFYIGAA